MTATHSYPQEQFFDSNNTRICYYQENRKAREAIVLIHGITGSAKKNWLDWRVSENSLSVFDELAKDFRVIALDCRGHGGSGKPHESNQYGRKMCQDVARLIEYLKLKNAHIIGYSMGGQITARLLIDRPDIFLTATIGGCRIPQCWNRQKAESDARDFENGLVPLSYIDRNQSQAEVSKKWLQGQDCHALAALTRERGELVVSVNEMASVETPVLGICGTDDGRLKGLLKLKDEMPGLKLQLIRGATHLKSRGAPRNEVFVTAIRKFIANPSGFISTIS